MRRHGLPPRRRKRNLLAPSAPKRAFESQNALGYGFIGDFSMKKDAAYNHLCAASFLL
jgi:hypothetical protein